MKTTLQQAIYVLLYLSCFLCQCHAFAPKIRSSRISFQTNKFRSASVTSLAAVSPKYSMPSQEESESLGIREWPQQTKTSAWKDEVSEDQTIVRYILQGSGTLYVDGSNAKFNTGMLVEVEGPATLEWDKNDGEDVIILTPGYETGGLFVGVIIGFIGMVAALVALS